MPAYMNPQEKVRLDRCVGKARELGFETIAVLDMKTLVSKPEVRDMCTVNKCASYGKKWGCPPGCGTIEQCQKMMEGYTLGVLIQTVGDLEDSWDFEGIAQAAGTHKLRFDALCDFMRSWEEKILPMSAGGCDLCESCAYPEPCRNPEKISYSVSAFGLLVNEVCKDNGVTYYYGSDKMAFTGMILFGEKGDSDEILGRIAVCAVEGKAGELIHLIRQALDMGLEPQKIALAMTERFLAIETEKSAAEQDLSRLLAGARATSRGMEVLRPYLQGNSGFYRYTAVIGTASGDLHDLGKNLVAMMLEVAGFRVVDLGIDISAEDFLRAVSEDDSIRLVGISCLLTTSLSAVERIAAKLNNHPRRKYFKLTVGGGATDENVAKHCGADAYTSSAVDAAEYARVLLEKLKNEE